MDLIRNATELKAGNRSVCLAIGVFDGVHLGHQQIIRQTISDARQHDGLAVVLTFDCHPNTIVAPDRVPPMIYSPSQKRRAIQMLGADVMLMLQFDRALSRQSGEEFIRSLAREVGRLHSICVGMDFVFGHKRSGDVSLLKKLGEESGFIVHGIAAVSLDGQVVSSTRVREAIQGGDFDAAGQMLGRAYSLVAPVVKGDGLGQSLGFPTANLDCNGLVLPPNGVYTARATVRSGTHLAVVNIGHRPTVQAPTPKLHVEAHVLDFSGALYGEEIEIAFTEKLRDEKKFGSLEELKKQIARDIAEARLRA